MTHIQQQFKLYIGVGCFDDACLGDDLPDVIPHRLKLYLIYQIDFIQDDDIRHADLMDGQHLMALVEAQDLFGIHHGQDAVNLHALDRSKRKRDFEWIGDTTGFNQNIFGWLWTLDQVACGL